MEPRPPRQWDETIPKELERICLKALAKRASDRYTTASDMADDLRHWVRGEGRGTRDEAERDEGRVTDDEFRRQPSAVESSSPLVPRPSPLVSPPAPITPSSTPLVRIVPKGLRSFDAHDADFYLELVPGARDRDGLPESIRFWKTHIEPCGADATLTVGLIYGPSGCGKSSLVKAGLLPRLAPHVIPVYLEATTTDTESRLVKSLRNACPGLSDIGSFNREPAASAFVHDQPHADAPDALAAGSRLNELPDLIAALRRGRGLPAGKKLLIVLDQFEQWLHANRQQMDRTPLAAALRQADGQHVQFLLLIRDDFWLGISRLFQELEIPLVEGENLRLADLFDLRHARRVLALFGQAYSCLPERSGDFNADQTAFLDSVVEGLSEDGKVISVRVSLLADMMKGRAWSPQSLRAVGGLSGIGVTFFDETFSARTASPEHRALEQPARGLLATLLPEAGTDIKGRMRSRVELLEASGLAAQPRRFDRLMAMLDSELRIITPTEAESFPNPAPGGRAFKRGWAAGTEPH